MIESAGGFKLEVALGEPAAPAVLDRVAALPSFFIIGPPRTGTSWLYNVLRERTLLPSPTKETRFFDTHFQRGMQWYVAHYPRPNPPQLMGEVAPTYFASMGARKRIARLLPEVKVICIFRNPVDRVVSLYRLKRAYGMTRWSFEEAIARDPELLETGKYATHLKSWQFALGSNRVLPTVYEDLRDNPQSYIDALVDFIGIPRFELTGAQIWHVHASQTLTHPRNYYRTRSATVVAEWLKARRLDCVVAAVRNSALLKLFLGGGPAFAELSLEVKRKVYELFQPEVEELAIMLNRDLSAWKFADPPLKAMPAIP